ncbi:MAG: hypothetical protein JJE50_01475 [Actinomycetales bacterium]|nr:hypothetical protein [Actinomycetales bacterium]
MVAVLRCERFVDMAPGEIHAILLDEGTYLRSVATMYRLLRKRGEVRERRRRATSAPRPGRGQLGPRVAARPTRARARKNPGDELIPALVPHHGRGRTKLRARRES